MADVLAVRDEYRAQQWAMVVQECATSGLSNREFCKQRGIVEKTFYYWQRKLRTQIIEASAPKLVQLEPAPVPVQNDLLQIQYRGAELKLPAGVDMDAVAALLRSIQVL
jgi:putative transposase